MKKILCLLLISLMLVSVSTASFSAVLAPTHWYGEVDEEEGIEVIDATQIQRYLASKVELSKLRLLLADFDGDGSVSVLDATNIQMYVAKMPSNRRMDDSIYCLPQVDGLVPSFSSGQAMAGVPVEFTINSSMYGDFEFAYPFSYECYLLDEYYENPILIYSGKSETFEYTFEKAGTYYFQIYVYNDFGDCTVNDMRYEVVEKSEVENFTASVSPKAFYYKDGETREFVAFAHFGKAPYEYCFVENDAIVQDYSEKNTVVVLPCTGVNNYTTASLTVFVRDADGNVVSNTCEYELSPNYPA